MANNIEVPREVVMGLDHIELLCRNRKAVLASPHTFVSMLPNEMTLGEVTKFSERVEPIVDRWSTPEVDRVRLQKIYARALAHNVGSVAFRFANDEVTALSCLQFMTRQDFPDWLDLRFRGFRFKTEIMDIIDRPVADYRGY